MLLKHSDNLSKNLQKTKLSAAEGQTVASLTVKTLEKLRTEEFYQLFWKRCIKEAEDLEIREPVLPRKRQHPPRYQIGNAPAEFQDNIESHYRSIYYEAIDTVVNCIKKRLENLILSAAKGEPCKELLSFVCNFYKDDFEKDKLDAQLSSLSGIFDEPVKDVQLVVKKFQKMSAGMKAYFSEVVILLKLLLIAPATNAISERSCSTLRRIKISDLL